MMKIATISRWVVALSGCLLLPLCSAKVPESFLGRWALTLPVHGSGWLELKEQEGKLSGALLWSGGGVDPLVSTELAGDTLHMVPRQLKDTTIEASVAGDEMKLVLLQLRGTETVRSPFSGQRMPPLRPAPDLFKAERGTPLNLFHEDDLRGWRADHAHRHNGWSMRDGVLTNTPIHAEGKHVPHANLRTEAVFEDFNLVFEVKVPPKGNSGVYLRGIYELQICDSHGRPPHMHLMGAIFSRITPMECAAKKAGEWQRFDVTLLQQHVTVVLNGVTIIDNQPLVGSTGGALWSDVTRPGPILLQGDHGAIDYRKMVLTPLSL